MTLLSILLLLLMLHFGVFSSTFDPPHPPKKRRRRQRRRHNLPPLLEIPQYFIDDPFNRQRLDSAYETREDYERDLESLHVANPNKLYKMLHKRYAVTLSGIDQFAQELKRASSQFSAYGRCPRIKCRRQSLIPSQHNGRLHCYCPSCGEAMDLMTGDNDGLTKGLEDAWGSDFAHLFMLIKGPEVFPHLYEENSELNNDYLQDDDDVVVPKIWGFKLFHYEK